MTDVILGTGATVVAFAPETTDQVRVTIRDQDLFATHHVYGHYADGHAGLAHYFSSLAADWRGWDGERAYESLEHDLTLVAGHDGHVHLSVRLAQAADPQGWSVEVRLTLDPGEELSRAASEIAALVV